MYLELGEVDFGLDNGETTDAFGADGLVVFRLRGGEQLVPDLLGVPAETPFVGADVVQDLLDGVQKQILDGVVLLHGGENDGDEDVAVGGTGSA